MAVLSEKSKKVIDSLSEQELRFEIEYFMDDAGNTEERIAAIMA